MKTSFYEVESIFKTLPIGYYIGRQVPSTLTLEEMSYYVPSEDIIHVSYPMIEDALSKVETNDASLIEQLIRTLLYHEVSHAFLTPNCLEMAPHINVFEDERIEQLCKNFYKNVDFKQLLMLVNDWDGKTRKSPKTADEAWYQVVRYHIGKQTFVIRVFDIINRYANINKRTASVYHYVYEVEDLYHDVIKDFEAEHADVEKTTASSTKSKISPNGSDENDDSTMSVTDETAQMLDGVCTKEQDTRLVDFLEHELAETSCTFENVKKAFDAAQCYYDAEILEKLQQIILSHKRVNKSNATAINAYSGVFDPRSVVRNDYKWFVQQNRIGNVRQFSKIKLNLFIDCSGSFCDNANAVNKLLLALKQIEKQDSNFSFDVITMNTNFTLLPKDNRILHCYGGNNIPDDAFEYVRNVQDAQATNYNIVLFDGYAFTDAIWSGQKKNFACFNVPNTVMILESSNQTCADEYCKNTRRIYSRDYVKQLFHQVCTALNFLFK